MHYFPGFLASFPLVLLHPRLKLTALPGTEQVIPCDLMLIAAGFVGCETATAERFGVKLNPRGCMMPEDGGHRLRDNLFSAGDMRTGQSLVVRALADGRTAATEIDRYLKGDCQ